MEKKQEELHALTQIGNGVASAAPALEDGQDETNISNLYKLLDNKDEEINLKTQLVEKLRLQMEVQEEFLASSQRDCARVQEELCSLQREIDDMRGEVKEVLSALEELALNCDRKSQKASNTACTNLTLSEQLAVKNEMLEVTRRELAELQELSAVQTRRTVDVLRVLLRDLSEMGSAIAVHEISMVCEDGVSIDEEFSVVRLFLAKLKAELKSLVNRTKQFENVHEHTSAKILDNERELASCHRLVSQYQVKIKSLTECVQKAEETKRTLEVTQRTLDEELTKLHTYESNRDVCELEKQKELLLMTHFQPSQAALVGRAGESQLKMLTQLREEFNNKQRVLDDLKELNENLVLEQKRQQCEYESLRIHEQEKEIQLQQLTVSNEKTEQTREELRDFEETLARQLQALHTLRKMFVQDLTTRVNMSTAQDCEDEGSHMLHERKLSFLENNLEQLTKVHKQLVRETADLRCELPKREKRLRAMMERVKALECALREAKQSASQERRLYQQEMDRVKDTIRAMNMACCGHAALINKPVRLGHHHTSSVNAERGGPAGYIYYHI